MKKLIKYLAVVIVLLTTVIAVNAQPPAGGPPPGGPSGGAPPPCWPPPCIPVDGGISFLIAIGAAFGGKKAYDHFKTESSPEE
jgi:hypothetical protein